MINNRDKSPYSGKETETKTFSVTVRPSVLHFAFEMEGILQANDYKGGCVE